MQQILTLPIIATLIMLLAAGLIWLFWCHGLDKIKHPEEWQTAGSAGERIFYNTLTKKFNIPDNQILRNVYVPTKNGKTSEIDLLIVSKKGIFVFEIKNYGGNIYGDASRPNWLQYIGRQKNFFYNPLLQNKNHVKHLRQFLAQDSTEVPIIPLMTTISRGKWKVKNLKADDYILGYNCHFKDIYESVPGSAQMAKNFKSILAKLTPLSRPDPEIRQNHIAELHKNSRDIINITNQRSKNGKH